MIKRRLIIVLILFSMVLHSASRLGVLSYLYKQRHDIAYVMGVITEVPIALCNSEYNLNSGLQIETVNDSDTTLPPQILLATEIQLFCNGFTEIVLNLDRLVIKKQKTLVAENPYCTPALSIFHPPS